LDLLEKMLKKNPKERVTPHQALAHPYFEEINENSDVMGGTTSDYPELNSPLFASKNPERKQLNKKDSCVDFKLGKENIITGKTEPVSGSVHSKLSGINFDAMKSPALVSKFAQKK
jgi:serine/threonine protein kinase